VNTDQTRALVLLVVVVGSLLLPGCSKARRASVSGKITVDNKAPGIKGVTISFVGIDNQAVTAEVAPDGTYTANGVLIGENKVSLNWIDASATDDTPPGPDADEKTVKEYKNKTEASKKPVKGRSPIPDRYNDPAKSPLQVVIEPGEANTFSPNLTK